MTSPQQFEITKDKTPGSRRSKRSTSRAKRGEGVLYDVIDEWLAPAFARWMASRDTGPNKKTP
jgi:hypothetical protein